MGYKIISFDMFQTLVDVNSRKYQVWTDILRDEYTREKAELFWSDILSYLSEYTEDIRKCKASFQPMRETFKRCYAKLFEKNNITIEAELAVEILFREHCKAPIFQDAKELFSIIDSKYQIWLSSDTDRDMIKELLPHFRHKHAFLSEEVGAYKQDEQGRFFKYVLERTNAKPEEILHIGDGLSDILGAKCAGIATCWINRYDKKWDNPIEPDFTIQSLLELKDIID